MLLARERVKKRKHLPDFVNRHLNYVVAAMDGHILYIVLLVWNVQSVRARHLSAK